MSGEGQAARFAVHAEDGDVVAALIAHVNELAGRVEIEPARIVPVRPFLTDEWSTHRFCRRRATCVGNTSRSGGPNVPTWPRMKPSSVLRCLPTKVSHHSRLFARSATTTDGVRPGRLSIQMLCGVLNCPSPLPGSPKVKGHLAFFS